MSAAFKLEPAAVADMRATAARNRGAQSTSRPSVCLNMISNGNMLDEYNETVAEVQELIAQLHIKNTIAAELKIHLQLQGIL